MTTILHGFTHETQHGNILLIERYIDKDSLVPFWKIAVSLPNDMARTLKDGLIRRPRKETIERYADIADANVGHKK